MRIKTDYVSPRFGLIKAGKEYEVLATVGGLKVITAENGFRLHASLTHCACLDGRGWQVVGEVETLKAEIKALKDRLNDISNMSAV